MNEIDEMEYLEKYRKLNPNALSNEQFILIETDIHNKTGIISSQYLDFKLWYQNLPSRQECFLDFLKNNYNLEKVVNILEVGGGENANLATMLVKEGYHVTCIDPLINLNIQDNIIRIKDYFDYQKFDVSKYDLVIGQEPCQATEHIIRACIQADVSFIIILCGTAHQLINGYMPKDVMEWYLYLYALTNYKASIKLLELYPQALNGMLAYIKE